MQLLAPLDALRRGAMHALVARPALAPWIRRKNRRIALLATAGPLAALAVASLAPALALVILPLALGVPHVAADARYLLIRPRAPRAVVALAALGSAALLAWRVLEGLAPALPFALPFASPWARGEIALALAWIALSALAGGALARERAGGARRAAIALGVTIALGAAALARPDGARVAFAHLHNVAAVVVWLALFRREGRARVALPALGAMGAAVAIALTGAPALVAHRLGIDAALGLDLAEVARTLGPGLPARAALGLAASFVVLQSVHYAVWLGWIPQEDTAGEGTLTFAMSARALVRDFRPIGLVAIVFAQLAVTVGALFDARGARDAYLSLASFHAYLELAMLAYYAVVTPRRACAAGAPARSPRARGAARRGAAATPAPSR